MRVHPIFPAISVLLPVRNAHATLDRSLDSLWRQTWSDFEILAVDDGSTDATPEILARHARREARLRVITATVLAWRYDIDPAKIDRAHRGAPIRSWTELAPAENDSLVVAVGIPGARSLILPETRRCGYREGEDLLFAA